MARIPKEEIEQIKSEADIVQVIGNYISVEGKGTDSYKAICPFHDDHDPSLHISKKRNDFKCFVCDTYGDAFEFVKLYEKVSFAEAVERVANIIGHRLSVDIHEVSYPVVETKSRYHAIMKEAVRYLNVQLDTNAGANAYSYLQKRKMSETIIQTFQIGYNPSYDAMYQYLKAKGYDDNDLIELHVASRSEHGMYDTFHDRITIPIHDGYGNPIGFTARRLNENMQSKYINTKTTPLFSKADILFNAHRAKEEARRKNKLYVTEGVFDVIAFARAGYMNCVCTLGTACTDLQIQRMKGLSSTIVFCYDSDSAGQAAILKAGRKAIEQYANVFVIENTFGKDPDEIITKEGQAVFEQLLSKEVEWPKFAIDYHRKNADLSTFSGKMDFQNKAMAEVNLLANEQARAYFAKYVEDISNLPVQVIPQIPENTFTPKPLKTVRVKDGASSAEELILGFMMQSQKAVDRFLQELGFLVNDDAFVLAMAIEDAWRSYGYCDVNRLMMEAVDDNQRYLIEEAMRSISIVEDNKEEVLDGAMVRIRMEVDHRAIQQKLNQLKEVEDVEQKGAIMQEIVTIQTRLRGYTKSE